MSLRLTGLNVQRCYILLLHELVCCSTVLPLSIINACRPEAVLSPCALGPALSIVISCMQASWPGTSC